MPSYRCKKVTQRTLKGDFLKSQLLKVVLSLDEAFSHEQKRNFDQARDCYKEVLSEVGATARQEGLSDNFNEVFEVAADSLLQMDGFWDKMVINCSDRTIKPNLKNVPENTKEFVETTARYWRSRYWKSWEDFRTTHYKGHKELRTKNLTEIFKFWHMVTSLLEAGMISARMTSRGHEEAVDNDNFDRSDFELVRENARLRKSKDPMDYAKFGLKLADKVATDQLAAGVEAVLAECRRLGIPEDDSHNRVSQYLHSIKDNFPTLKLPDVRFNFGLKSGPAMNVELGQNHGYIDDLFDDE